MRETQQQSPIIMELHELQKQKPLEFNIGIDEEKAMECEHVLGIFYKVQRHVRGWLLSHVDYPEESRQVLSGFRSFFQPIHDALGDCTTNQRGILELRYGEHRDDSEIGHHLSMEPEIIVRSRFSAFKKLTEHPAIQFLFKK